MSEKETFEPQFLGDDIYRQEERRRRQANELANIYITCILIGLFAIGWLWAHDWDLRCLFIECRLWK